LDSSNDKNDTINYDSDQHLPEIGDPNISIPLLSNKHRLMKKRMQIKKSDELKSKMMNTM